MTLNILCSNLLGKVGSGNYPKRITPPTLRRTHTSNATHIQLHSPVAFTLPSYPYSPALCHVLPTFLSIPSPTSKNVTRTFATTQMTLHSLHTPDILLLFLRLSLTFSLNYCAYKITCCPPNHLQSPRSSALSHTTLTFSSELGNSGGDWSIISHQ